MSTSLTVIGLSSQSTLKEFTQQDLSSLQHGPPCSLMDFLRDQGIPIASSCYGEGVCRKCVVNKQLLSCQTTIQDFLNNCDTISVDYL